MGELTSLKNGMQILPLMATTVEYGAHLKARIEPYIIGVGPVEAGINTAKILQQCTRAPNFVLLIGSSGSATLKQGEIYQANSVRYRDMDASAIGFEKGKTPFVDMPAVLPLSPTFDFLSQASLSTGGKVIVGQEFNAIEAELVDMETFAVKRACQAFDIPLIALRGISDGKKELQQFQDWTELLPLLDEKLAGAVDKIIHALETNVY